MNKVLENIKTAIKCLEDNEESYQELIDSLSLSDKKIDYWLHYIELENIKITESYKILKEIKNIRQERRMIKNQIEIMQSFRENQAKLCNSGNRKLLLNQICKIENKQNNAKYNYDSYTEEEIRKILGGKNEKDSKK